MQASRGSTLETRPALGSSLSICCRPLHPPSSPRCPSAPSTAVQTPPGSSAIHHELSVSNRTSQIMRGAMESKAYEFGAVIDFAMRGTRSDADDFDEERQVAALVLLLCPASYLGMHMPISPGPSSPPHSRPAPLSNVLLPHACRLNDSLLVLWSDSFLSPHWCTYLC